jgi:Na+/melibiose symporter-like transporter
MISQLKILISLILIPYIKSSFTKEEMWEYGIASSICVSSLNWIMAIILITLTKLKSFSGL